MITRLYSTIYQQRLPVELRFGVEKAGAERMLRHVEILVPYPPEAVEKNARSLMRELARSSQLSVTARLATVLLALLGLLVSGLGLLGPQIMAVLVVLVVVGAGLLYAYSICERRRSAGPYPAHYYEERLASWLVDAARIAATRSVEGGVSRGRAIIGGLIYDYTVERRRGRVYLRLRPV